MGCTDEHLSSIGEAVVFRIICRSLSTLFVVAVPVRELTELTEAECEQALSRYRLIEAHLQHGEAKVGHWSGMTVPEGLLVGALSSAGDHGMRTVAPAR